MPTRKKILNPGRGANQVGVRAHNERLVLSLIRRHRQLPKAEIARRSGLSPQTVSTIVRNLEREGLLKRRELIRGKVGQPSVPMALNPMGALSIGLKIGRRSADLVLMDFIGNPRQLRHHIYPYPQPEPVMRFLREGLSKFNAHLSTDLQNRTIGIGVAAPFELWNWHHEVGAPQSVMDAWREFDFHAAIGEVSDLPVYVENDATSACSAEHTFGHGHEFVDFAYFFVGSFVGGGIVLNHTIYPGRTGNAGAFGTMPVRNKDAAVQVDAQLIDTASIFVLENMLKEAGIDPSPLWLIPDSWASFSSFVERWSEHAAKHLATAVVAVCCVIDFEVIVIDGGFPPAVRALLVEKTRAHIASIDTQGITPPVILEGTIGRSARVLGAACLPFFSHYLLKQDALFKVPHER